MWWSLCWNQIPRRNHIITASWRPGPLVSVTSLTPRCRFLIYMLRRVHFSRPCCIKRSRISSRIFWGGREKAAGKEKKKSHSKHAQFLFRLFFLELCFAPMCTHSNTGWFISYLYIYFFATKWMLSPHVVPACKHFIFHRSEPFKKCVQGRQDRMEWTEFLKISVPQTNGKKQETEVKK